MKFSFVYIMRSFALSFLVLTCGQGNSSTGRNSSSDADNNGSKGGAKTGTDNNGSKRETKMDTDDSSKLGPKELKLLEIVNDPACLKPSKNPSYLVNTKPIVFRIKIGPEYYKNATRIELCLNKPSLKFDQSVSLVWGAILLETDRVGQLLGIADWGSLLNTMASGPVKSFWKSAPSQFQDEGNSTIKAIVPEGGDGFPPNR